jgi:hypothetical protein
MSQNSSPYYQLVNNFPFPKIFTPENIEFILNYKPEKDEKFIAVYPKCGSTWTQHIICLILNNGIIQKSDSELIENSYFDKYAKESLKISMKPRVLKTHLPFDLMPYNKSAQYLCVLRNPKDTCVSMYYFVKGFAPEDFADIVHDFHKFFDCWIKGEFPFGDYFRHVLSYWTHRFDDNFTFLVYEHMKKKSKRSCSQNR